MDPSDASKRFAELLKLEDSDSVAAASLHSSKDVMKELRDEIGKLFQNSEAVVSGFCARFSSDHLPALFDAYQATPDEHLVTPYTEMIGVLLDRGHFASFTKTVKGKELLEIQARRVAGKGLPRELEQIFNVVQLLNFFVAYEYHNAGKVNPVIKEEYRKTIRDKCDAWRHLCYDQRTDPKAEHLFNNLTETIEFLDGKRSPATMLGAVGKMMPLATCGDINSGCWSTGVVPTLTCSRCKCVRYCGPAHQKSDWRGHKPACIAPPWAA